MMVFQNLSWPHWGRMLLWGKRTVVHWREGADCSWNTFHLIWNDSCNLICLLNIHHLYINPNVCCFLWNHFDNQRAKSNSKRRFKSTRAKKGFQPLSPLQSTDRCFSHKISQRVKPIKQKEKKIQKSSWIIRFADVLQTAPNKRLLQFPRLTTRVADLPPDWNS